MPWRPQYYLAVPQPRINAFPLYSPNRNVLAQPIGQPFLLYTSNTNMLPQKMMPQAWSTVNVQGKKQNSDDDDGNGVKKPKKKRSK